MDNTRGGKSSRRREQQHNTGCSIHVHASLRSVVRNYDWLAHNVLIEGDVGVSMLIRE